MDVEDEISQQVGKWNRMLKCDRQISNNAKRVVFLAERHVVIEIALPSVSSARELCQSWTWVNLLNPFQPNPLDDWSSPIHVVPRWPCVFRPTSNPIKSIVPRSGENIVNCYRPNKNLAIANRSRVSSTHNTLKASIGLNITPWPWNPGYGHSMSLETEPLVRSYTTYYWSSYLTLNIIVTLKCGLQITQGHWKW